MPAIARFDDTYARLLRGFVDRGLPDGTRVRVADSDLSVELLLRGTGGILLRFPATVASMDDGWTYTVKALPGRGERVVVRCAETLFRADWDLSASATADKATEDPAGNILATVIEHNRVFGEWTQGGGSVSRVERMEHPDDPADTLHPELRRWLAALYMEGKSLNDGPALSWWAGTPGDRRAVGKGITTGSGAEPVYRLGPEEVAVLDTAHLEHLEQMNTAGTAVWVNATLTLLVACASGSWNVWKSYSLGAMPWYAVAAIVSVGVAVLWIPLGQALRSPRERWLFRGSPAPAKWVLIALAVIGMLPWSGPCCLAGFPLGGWIVYLLLDKKTKRLL